MTTTIKPVPDGDYWTVIDDAGIEQSKSGVYMMAWFRHKVLGPGHAGRLLFKRIIVGAAPGVERVANPEAIKIGQRTLKELAECAGHKNPNFVTDTSEFIDLHVMVRVEVKAEHNEIKRYLKSSSAPPAAVHPYAPGGQADKAPMWWEGA